MEKLSHIKNGKNMLTIKKLHKSMYCRSKNKVEDYIGKWWQ